MLIHNAAVQALVIGIAYFLPITRQGAHQRKNSRVINILPGYFQVIIGNFHHQKVFPELISSGPRKYVESWQVNYHWFYHYLHGVTFTGYIGRYNNPGWGITYASENQSVQFMRYKRKITLVIRRINSFMRCGIGNIHIGHNYFSTVGIMHNTTKLYQRLFFVLCKRRYRNK